jgi:multidrug efflux pump subunit AcrA (membrane-fusion protein)
VQRFLILFLMIFSLLGCTPQANFGDAITEGEPTPVPTSVIPSRPVYEVLRGDVIDQRTYYGRVSAVRTAPLNFEIDGRVAETFFSAGENVVAGDVIAELDTTGLEAQLLNAEEALAVAQSLLDRATNQLNFARQRASLGVDLAQINLDFATLQAAEPPSAEDTLRIQQREIELQLAQLTLEEIAEGVDPALEFDVSRAQEDVDNLNALIDNATLLAPMSGRLMTLFVESGDSVSALEAIGVIADVSELEVTNVIENSELSELTEGLPVLLQQTSSPDEVYEGSIYQLPQPFGLATDGLIHVRFNIPTSQNTFELGERMSYVVTIAERQDVLWLPLGAIRQFSGRDFVVIQDNGVERRLDVLLGLEGNDRVEILEGLEEGQQVIAP